MQNILKSFLLLSALLVVFAMPAKADTTIIAVLSTQQTQEQMGRSVNQLRSWLLAMPKGGSILVVDGEYGHSLATLTRPTKANYQAPRTILKLNGRGFAQLAQLIKTRTKSTGTSAALNLPRVLEVIAQNYPQVSDIALLGAASFGAPDTIPADNVLGEGSRVTAYGTSDVKERLKGKRVHWLLSNTMRSHSHAQKVERFIHLYLHNQAAELVTFSADAALVKARLFGQAEPKDMPYQISKVSTATSLDRLFTRSPAKVGALNSRQKHTVKIGIAWSAPVDLDIYALVQGQARPVYYANTKGSYGASHHKDVRKGNRQTTYEIISYAQPVRLCDIHIAVNHYSGNDGARIQGTLRVEAGQHLIAKDFDFSKQAGNGGADTKAVLQSQKSSHHTLYFSLNSLLDIKECTA